MNNLCCRFCIHSFKLPLCIHSGGILVVFSMLLKKSNATVKLVIVFLDNFFHFIVLPLCPPLILQFIFYQIVIHPNKSVRKHIFTKFKSLDPVFLEIGNEMVVKHALQYLCRTIQFRTSEVSDGTFWD